MEPDYFPKVRFFFSELKGKLLMRKMIGENVDCYGQWQPHNRKNRLPRRYSPTSTGAVFHYYTNVRAVRVISNA